MQLQRVHVVIMQGYSASILVNDQDEGSTQLITLFLMEFSLPREILFSLFLIVPIFPYEN